MTRSRFAWIAGATILLAITAGVYVWMQRTQVAGPVRVTAPDAVWIEPGANAQLLHFDFELDNLGPTPLVLVGIDFAAFDASGGAVVRLSMDSPVVEAATQSAPRRVILPGKTVLVPNPFNRFPAGMDLARLEFRFRLGVPGEAPGTSATVIVRPKPRQPGSGALR